MEDTRLAAKLREFVALDSRTRRLPTERALSTEFVAGTRIVEFKSWNCLPQIGDCLVAF